MAEASDLTPEQWLARLGEKINARRPWVGYFQRYYDGEHDLPAGPEQDRESFRRFQRVARTNLCKIAVESMVHRTRAIGYRSGSGRDDVDRQVWGLWQDARLDGRQSAIYRKALTVGSSYVIVGADPRRPGKARVTIESAANVYVETDPADASVRLAALRLWFDSIAGRWLATLYLPGARYHWQARSKSDGSQSPSFGATQWEQRSDPATGPETVPVVPFFNGDEGDEPTAVFSGGGIDVQNRLNLSLLNRLTAERYAAFRQRWATNLPLADDPVTGLPIVPFDPSTKSLWAVSPGEPGDPEPHFGDFAQTMTSDMLRGVEADMRAFAAVTLTPVYYLPGDLVNIGADAINALDAGHNAKVREATARWGESLEEVLALCAKAAGVDADLTSGELAFARPENLNPAQVADYGSKLRGMGYPLAIVAERMGDSPQQVETLRSEAAAEALTSTLAAPTALDGAPAPSSAPEPAQPVAGS